MHHLTRIATLLAALTAAASAGQRDLDVDIDELSGELARGEHEWLLEVRYEVEVEGATAAGPFDLVLNVSEHDRLLTDGERRPLVFAIPLDRPTDVDDDEAEYEGTVMVSLPRDSFVDPDDLELVGRVYVRGDDRPVAHDDDDIDYDRPGRRRIGLSIGYGYCGVGIGIGF